MVMGGTLATAVSRNPMGGAARVSRCGAVDGCCLPAVIGGGAKFNHIMYSPGHFQINDPETLTAFMREHSFATIVTHDGAVPHATHMPVLLDPDRGPQGTLVSHMARANPQWKHFADGREVLVIFTGPHAYVSPAWYATTPAVPTWNYTAVHA